MSQKEMLITYDDVLSNMSAMDVDIDTIEEMNYAVFCRLRDMSPSITPRYINNLVAQREMRVMFYCINDVFDLHNCPVILLFHVSRQYDVYLHLMVTHPRYRQMGYGKMVLKEFIEWCRLEGFAQIILSSVMESVTFYEELGFHWTRDPLSQYPHLSKFEPPVSQKMPEHFIMVYGLECPKFECEFYSPITDDCDSFTS